MKIFRSQFTLNANAKKKGWKGPKKYLGAYIREKEISQMCIRDTHQKIKRDRYVYKLTAMLLILFMQHVLRFGFGRESSLRLFGFSEMETMIWLTHVKM